jgi:quinol monooxygenase YgiN
VLHQATINRTTTQLQIQEDIMYGTIARLQVKPTSLEALMQWGSSRSDTNSIPGYVSQVVYQMDNNPNELYLVVIFEDKESYMANAKNPQQHARYEEMRAMLAADPEWHDGAVVYSHEAVRQGI